MEDNSLVSICKANGVIDICCPHCKKVIFSGFYEGITMYDLEGKCPLCNEKIIQNVLKVRLIGKKE